MIKRGIIRESIDVFQWGYRSDVVASAGTHSQGGCIDVGQFSWEALEVWRMLGWAMQDRSPFFEQDHGHGWPEGCPHLSEDAQVQDYEWNQYRNGLLGKGPITGPGPIGPALLDWDIALTRYLAQTEGVIELPDTFKAYRRSTDQTIKADGVWQYLKINELSYVTIANAPCSIKSGTINVKTKGNLPLQFRIVEDDVASGGQVLQTAHASVGAALPSSENAPFTRNPGKAPSGTRKIRLQVRGAKGTVIERVNIDFFRGDRG
jgi:hypothetical protein